MGVILIILQVLAVALDIVRWIVIAWVILSWILFFLGRSKFKWRYRQFYLLLEQLNDICTRMTYPFLKPIRRWLRRFDTAGIDWSPLVLLLIIYLFQLLIAYVAAILPR
ncbi:MAG TPA: YggT family protein [Thermoanaerobaculia bacterium]|nr:YggT family protein [Thermoanaerobaculia bacterium]